MQEKLKKDEINLHILFFFYTFATKLMNYENCDYWSR